MNYFQITVSVLLYQSPNDVITPLQDEETLLNESHCAQNNPLKILMDLISEPNYKTSQLLLYARYGTTGFESPAKSFVRYVAGVFF